MPQPGPSTGNNTTPLPPAAPTIAEAVTQLFTRYDLDLNASITLAEIQSVLIPGPSSISLATRLATLVTSIDGNADGMLSNAEVTAAVTALDTDADGLIEFSDRVKTGTPSSTTIDIGMLLPAPGSHLRQRDPGNKDGTGPQGPGASVDVVSPRDPANVHGTTPLDPGKGGGTPSRPVPQVVDGVVAHLDASGDASITLSEAQSYFGGFARGVALANEFTGIFNAVDTDHDGRMSPAELTTAITPLDTNRNGTLDAVDTALDQISGISIELAGVLMHELGIGCGV